MQIHDLPDGYKSMIKPLASKVSEHIYTKMPSPDFAGNFFRVRVKLDARMPLKNVISLIRGGKRELFLVQYEKLPDWCVVCGMLGHTYKEHGMEFTHQPP
jgi:hypothetical protein